MTVLVLVSVIDIELTLMTWGPLLEVHVTTSPASKNPVELKFVIRVLNPGWPRMGVLASKLCAVQPAEMANAGIGDIATKAAGTIVAPIPQIFRIVTQFQRLILQNLRIFTSRRI